MRAVILAGGKGTRLRPYTTLIPKPLVPIGGKYSILEIIIKQLANSGFTHITLAVNHLSQLIQAFFGSGERLNVKIDYSLEEGELSTIGPLTLIKDLPENFLVMNGDILCDLSYQNFYSQHISSGASISVSTFKREVKVDFGVLRYGADHLLTEFQEKPKYEFDVSMGIYCISRNVISSLSQGERYGFDNLMWDSLKEDRPVNIQPFNGYWLDIGRPEDYEYADENFDDLAQKLGIS
jgi:NDP-sugar pyrophosphorylase family protein